MSSLLEQMKADAGADSAAPATLLEQMQADAANAGSASAAPVPQKTGTGNSLLDAGNALGTGYWRGMARLAGLPADTAQNVIDLGKAAVGAPYIAITGKEPPSWLQLGDRSNVVGSGDNLIKNLSKTKAGDLMVNPANPAYEGGYIQAAGGGMAGATTNGQAALGAISALTGKGVMDATGNQALAIAAGLAPSLTVNPVSATAKKMVRGGEQGRQAMVQRVADLKAAGIDEPTLGLASGNQILSGTENLLRQTPGAMGIMSNARAKTLAGLQGTVEDAVNQASATRGDLPAGTAIQADVNNFYPTRIQPGYVRLNDRAEGVIGSGTPVQVANSVATTGRLSTPNPGAPAITESLIQPRIRRWNTDLLSDQGGTPAYTDGVGMLHPEVPPTGIPYGALKSLRTSIGAEAGSIPIRGTPEQGQIKQVYGALSQDMNQAAAQSDLNNGRILSANLPTSATGALSRANNYYDAGMNRLDAVQSFANAAAPETAYQQLINSAKSRNSVAQTLMKTVEPETRGTIAATFLDGLGRATPGNQNHSGDAWSPDTFLTNWNKLSPDAQKTMTSGFPGASDVQAKIAAVAKAADLLKNQKMWTNPSGTAAASAIRNGAYVVGGALTGVISPWAPVGLAVAPGITNIGARMLTSPKAVKWASEDTPLLSTSSADGSNAVRALMASGLIDKPIEQATK